MRTTIILNDDLVNEAMDLYKVKTKTRIIEMGLEELIKKHKRARLVRAFGSQPELAEPRRRR
jgi:hypothetical protein